MTAQIHEKLIFEGKLVSMTAFPNIPVGHERIHINSDEEARQSTAPVFSTACWRGYVGSWKIKAGRLYLTAIEGRFKLLGDEPLLADWFSGTLVVPQGKMLQYVHMGFESIYEEQVLISVEKGIVSEVTRVDIRNGIEGEPPFSPQP